MSDYFDMSVQRVPEFGPEWGDESHQQHRIELFRAWAKGYKRLQKELEYGETLQEYLEAVEELTGKRSPLLAHAALPKGGELAAVVYLTLAKAGAWVSLSGVEAWQRATEIQLSPNEVDLVLSVNEGEAS